MYSKKYLAILLLTTISLLSIITKTYGSWVLETVDSEGDVGTNSSMAIDSLDNVHISYLVLDDGDLKYATNAFGTWVTNTVDSDGRVGQYSSLAIDSSDNIHISYRKFHDTSSSDLKYATNASGLWSLNTIDSSGNVGEYTSLAIDSSDNIHIIYYDADNGDLKYATNASGTWVTNTMVSSEYTGMYTSMAIDSLDNIHVCYYGNGELIHATNASGKWVASIVESVNIFDVTSLAVDSSGNVHISYFDFMNPGLKYATNTSGSWVLNIVDNIGMYSSLAIDSSDNVHISYYDLFNDQLKYTTNATGTWATSTVGDGGVDTSIAIDSFDNVHISHFGFNNEDLMYAVTLQEKIVTNIKANNSGSTITIKKNEDLTIKISLSAGNSLGQDCDWWTVVNTPSGWQYYNLAQGDFASGFSVTYQNALFDLGPTSIFIDTSSMSTGAYTYYFGVDLNKNGTLDSEQSYYDSVKVNIGPAAFKLPDTGQTGSYTNTSGEDSDYTINSPSYTDNGDGTVTDNNTELMWQQNDGGTEMNWDNASSYCETLSLADFSDWRLPEITELAFIANSDNYYLSIDKTYFLNTDTISTIFYSSTPWSGPDDPDINIWCLVFSYGYVSYGDKKTSYNVRCVRGKQNTTSLRDNGNGTVTDRKTGLMWQQEDEETLLTWEEAITYCEGVSLAGNSDWRLPNKNELISIVNYNKYRPTIDETYFPNTNSSLLYHHWSSTTIMYNTGNAWDVHFENGNANQRAKTSNQYARCVRGND